jgi:eukaryotic-like serine/threonine-protein kinase
MLSLYRLAERLKLDYADAHCSLGFVLYQFGEYAGAAVETRKGQELRCKLAGMPFSSTGLIEHLDRMAALAARLPAIVKGADRPKDANERVVLANMAFDSELYATAVGLWAEALDSQPDLGEDRQAQHRYNAACAVARLVAGDDKNEPSPDAARSALLRQRAMKWLKIELDTWAKLLDEGKPDDAATVAFTLAYWRTDSELASIRDAAVLDKIPADERKDWRDLWSEVDALLAKARAASRR